MPVKISIGLSDEELLAQLAKQKTSWEKNEKAADDFGKSAAKAERAAVSHGKNLVKQHRSAEQALKDRVAAVDAAAKKGEISDEQRKTTIAGIIRKYREAGEAAKAAEDKAAETALKSTKAYKEKAASIDRGRTKVKQLAESTQTLAQKNRALKKDIVAAYKAGEVSVDEMKTSIRELNRQHAETKKGNPFGGDALASVKSYALGVASVGTAIAVVKRAFESYQAEVQKGRDQTIGLRDTRTSLLQVSDESNFAQRLGRSDQAAAKFGVERDKAAVALFDSISNEVEQDFERILRADRVIPADIGAKFVGEFRKVFAKENLTADQSLNLGLSAAGTSKFNVQEIQPQIRTAAQGSALLPGVEASDVAAFVSVLGSQFGDRTGTYVRSLQANAGAELIAQRDALKALESSTGKGVELKRKTAQENIAILSKSLPDLVGELSRNKDLRGKITGGNKEVLTALTVAIKNLDKIREVDATIERDTKLAGTDQSLISKRLRAFFSDPKLALDFKNAQEKVGREISAEESFSAKKATVEIRSNKAANQLNEGNAGFIERAVVGTFVGAANLIQSATGLGLDADTKRQADAAAERVDALVAGTNKTNELLEKMAGQDNNLANRPGDPSGLSRPGEDR